MLEFIITFAFNFESLWFCEEPITKALLEGASALRHFIHPWWRHLPPQVQARHLFERGREREPEGNTTIQINGNRSRGSYVCCHNFHKGMTMARKDFNFRLSGYMRLCEKQETFRRAISYHLILGGLLAPRPKTVR